VAQAKDQSVAQLVVATVCRSVPVEAVPLATTWEVELFAPFLQAPMLVVVAHLEEVLDRLQA